MFLLRNDWSIQRHSALTGAIRSFKTTGTFFKPEMGMQVTKNNTIVGSFMAAVTAFAGAANGAMVESFNAAAGSYNPYSGWNTSVPVTITTGSLNYAGALASSGNRATGFSSANYQDLADSFAQGETLWGSYLFSLNMQNAVPSIGFFLQQTTSANTGTTDTVEITPRYNQLIFRANGTSANISTSISAFDTHMLVFCKTPVAGGMDEWNVWIDPGADLGAPVYTRTAPARDYGRLRIGLIQGGIDEVRLDSLESGVRPVPAPTSALLLALGGMAAARRRR